MSGSLWLLLKLSTVAVTAAECGNENKKEGDGESFLCLPIKQ